MRASQKVVDRPSVSARLSKLITLHGLETRRTEVLDNFWALTGQAIGSYNPELARRRSTLTRDGLPLELSVSLSLEKKRSGFRYVGEANDLQAPYQTRLSQSNRATSRVLARLGAEHWQGLHRALYETLFPKTVAASSDRRFGMWHGQAHCIGRPDLLKVYYNLSPWKEEISSVLSQIGSILRDYASVNGFEETVQALPEHTQPVFLGVNYASGQQRTNFKVYSRFRGAAAKGQLRDPFDRLGLGAQAVAFEKFHHQLFGERDQYPERSLMLSTRLSPSRDEPALSVHLALNRFFRSDAGALRSIGSVLTARDMDEGLYERALKIAAGEEISAQGLRTHSMIAFGSSTDGESINVYMKPNWSAYSNSPSSV